MLTQRQEIEVAPTELLPNEWGPSWKTLAVLPRQKSFVMGDVLEIKFPVSGRMVGFIADELIVSTVGGMSLGRGSPTDDPFTIQFVIYASGKAASIKRWGK